MAAAHALDYRPNHFARSLRVRRTFTIGVITVEIGDAYGSMLISGIEQYLRKNNFFFLTVAHRHDKKLLDTYSQLLIQRGVEGIISIDTQIGETPRLPTVAIAGHGHTEGVTNVILDQRRAAELALRHLVELGHRDIAFMKGSTYSSDTDSRWKAVCEVARDLGLKMRPELIAQLEGFDPTPQLGYPPTKKLLAQKRPFTALFAYNDISAIGAIHAIQESGLRVPEDVSVVGLDDIEIAVHYTPSLTTVRQPLLKMGETAGAHIDRETRRKRQTRAGAFHRAGAGGEEVDGSGKTDVGATFSRRPAWGELFRAARFPPLLLLRRNDRRRRL